jgi:transposase
VRSPEVEVLEPRRARRGRGFDVDRERDVERLRARIRELEAERTDLYFRTKAADRTRAELGEAREEIARLRAEVAAARALAGSAETEKENARLRARVAELEKINQELLERIETLERAGKRQAAPFSKGPPKLNPKRPGRKPGTRYGKRASRPVPEKADETHDVPFPRVCECGGEVEEEGVFDQWQTDVPPVRPIRRRFRVHVGRCRKCGRRVQPRHPLQASDALGAAAVQIGPNAFALATVLSKSYAVSFVKISTFFKCAFGLVVAPSTLCRAVLRVADRLQPTYCALVLATRESLVVYADETGWKTGGYKRWLWGFTTLRITVYVIAASRGGDVVREILGEDFAGTLGRDGWAAYVPALPLATFQTCFFHLLRRCHEILKVAKRGAAKFAHAVLRLLRAALELNARREELTEHGFAVLRGRIAARIDRLLRWEPSYGPNAKFVKHLRNERPHLLTFLSDPNVEATNWPGEHAMRAGVLARKVSGGTRTDRGSHAHAVLTSILTTSAQQDRDTLKLLNVAFRAQGHVELDLLPEPEG